MDRIIEESDTMKRMQSIVSRGMAVAAAALLIAGGAPSATAQPSARTLVADALPYGLTWQENDSTITMKVVSHDSSMIDAISTPEPGVVMIEGTKFSKFVAREMVLRLNDENRVVSTSWTFTGTRILTPIGIYDYLLPAIRMELGEPQGPNDTALTTEEIRSTTKNDRELYSTMRQEGFTLFSRWDVRKKGRDLIVDLRVDNETGHTILSITDRDALKTAVAGEEVPEGTEATDLTDTSTADEAVEADVQIDSNTDETTTADPATADDPAKEGSNLETSS